MWNSSQLKENAKAVLRVSYWKAFLVSLISVLVSSQDIFSFNYNQSDFNGLSQGIEPFLTLPVITMLFGTFFSLTIASSLISIFVLGPLEVGTQHYFLESTQMRFRLENITRGFTGGRYRNVVMTMLLRNIYIFLWSLLLLIPGIIKSYSYAMVPFLLAENPGIPPSRAIEMSMAMTDGHKWRMFVLTLSFIGWFLLGMLAMVIGVLFVVPYYDTTQAELYVALRAIALDKGIITLSDLETH
ncbi:DUF975 family protein [Oscillospiraceae bacterium LTW-04]|nr:DUF975 family protein [Oscillospiraceae bacterium MB24-C1]